jgi:hypothetical protein
MFGVITYHQNFHHMHPTILNLCWLNEHIGNPTKILKDESIKTYLEQKW